MTEQSAYEGRVHPKVMRMAEFYTELLDSIDEATAGYLETDPEERANVERLTKRLKKDLNTWKDQWVDKHVV